MITEYQIVKTDEHNGKDTASFGVQNYENLAKNFYREKSFSKEIYAVNEEGKKLCLLKQNEGEEFPRNMSLYSAQTDSTFREDGQKAAFRLYETVVRMYLKEKQKKTERLLEMAGSKLERRQAAVNYTKLIKKKQESCKIFKNCRMEGYDFREMELENTIFFNCRLQGANFSHVNLEHALFLNCSLEDAIFYKAHVNGAMVLDGDCIPLLKMRGE